MSSLVFPDLPGLDVAVDREAIYATTINETASGQEQRTSWRANPRYHYKLKFNALRSDVAAPSPFGSYNEVSVILNFLDTHKGAWDSFLFNDPYSGSQVRVRFVEDTLSVTKVAQNIWEADFELISVLS